MDELTKLRRELEKTKEDLLILKESSVREIKKFSALNFVLTIENCRMRTKAYCKLGDDSF